MKDKWEDNDVDAKAHILAYCQIRDYEDQKEREALYQCLGAKV